MYLSNSTSDMQEAITINYILLLSICALIIVLIFAFLLYYCIKLCKLNYRNEISNNYTEFDENFTHDYSKFNHVTFV
ncbi:hypothetical protein [Pteropox virus]|uniref:Uncharacterized protein n=1 Tax=Pteropox virus TaxID=1873698 RepID=A0A1B1MRA5_9POXV|nr:hypothetical protein [Pteropox virus]ANS71117.1 hypothetical protein [Pteropox virus]